MIRLASQLPGEPINEPKYRFRLTREISSGPGLTVGFVMLNPSTADDNVDDPTIRRCIGFAETWGYKRLHVTNLWALRATSPDDLVAAGSDAFHPANPEAVEGMVLESDAVVLAWGNNVERMTRVGHEALDVEAMCEYWGTYPMRIGSLTKQGHPRHPLYLKKSTLRQQMWPVLS